MKKKIFISYKYADKLVPKLNGFSDTTVRDYVDIIQDLIGVENINKGEKDGEDLSRFKDSTIESKLRAKIYDSSVTLVVISKGMKDPYKSEKDQWIPWEISYSLKEYSRGDRVSRTNAILAVVLPDEFYSFDYCLKEYNCCSLNCIEYNTWFHFGIIKENMFNRINKDFYRCTMGDIHTGDYSYIHFVNWVDFLRNHNGAIEKAVKLSESIGDFKIIKEIR